MVIRTNLIFRMDSLKLMLDKIGTCLEEHDALDRALANQEEDDVDSDGEESAESKQLRRDYNVANKEVHLLNNSVPEGLPDDCEFQYFLTLAELQKNIDELKAIKAMSEKNLAFMEQQFQRQYSYF